MITISLKTDSDIPMYIQIYEYIKKEILAGRLSAPEKLPSARSLAAHLQVSRSTVDTAYEQLVAEGYVDAREKRGYFVNSITHMAGFTDSVVPDFSTESIYLLHRNFLSLIRMPLIPLIFLIPYGNPLAKTS